MRFLLDWRTGAAAGGPDDVDGEAPEKLAAAAAKLDLVANVFRDGVHGGLVMTRLQVRLIWHQCGGPDAATCKFVPAVLPVWHRSSLGPCSICRARA